MAAGGSVRKEAEEDGGSSSQASGQAGRRGEEEKSASLESGQRGREGGAVRSAVERRWTAALDRRGEWRRRGRRSQWKRRQARKHEEGTDRERTMDTQRGRGAEVQRGGQREAKKTARSVLNPSRPQLKTRTKSEHGETLSDIEV